MKLYIFSLVFLAISARSRSDRYDAIYDETAGSFTYNIKKKFVEFGKNRNFG